MQTSMIHCLSQSFHKIVLAYQEQSQTTRESQSVAEREMTLHWLGSS